MNPDFRGLCDIGFGIGGDAPEHSSSNKRSANNIFNCKI